MITPDSAWALDLVVEAARDAAPLLRVDGFIRGGAERSAVWLTVDGLRAPMFIWIDVDDLETLPDANAVIRFVHGRVRDAIDEVRANLGGDP